MRLLRYRGEGKRQECYSGGSEERCTKISSTCTSPEYWESLSHIVHTEALIESSHQPALVGREKKKSAPAQMPMGLWLLQH